MELEKEKELNIVIMVIDMKVILEMAWLKGKEFAYNNGDRYEGDFRNDKKDGKGFYYYNNGDREMGDYHNDKPIGKHVGLTRNGEVKIINY